MKIAIATSLLVNTRFELFVDERRVNVTEELRALITRLRDEHKCFKHWNLGELSGDWDAKLYRIRNEESVAIFRFSWDEVTSRTEEELVEWFWTRKALLASSPDVEMD